MQHADAAVEEAPPTDDLTLAIILKAIARGELVHTDEDLVSLLAMLDLLDLLTRRTR